jgi:multicomponent Na+:H+ antiporter subunit F
MEIGLAYFNLAAAFFILVSMVMMLGRLLGGPTLYDRLLAVNSFGTKTVLFLCVFCFVIGRPDGVDIAILYALMNFIATVAVLKFFRYRALDVSLETAHIDKSSAEDAS